MLTKLLLIKENLPSLLLQLLLIKVDIPLPLHLTCTRTFIPLSAAAEQGGHPPPIAPAPGLHPLILFAAAHQGGHPLPLAPLSEPVVINSPVELTIDDSVGDEYEQPYYKTHLNQDQRSRL